MVRLDSKGPPKTKQSKNIVKAGAFQRYLCFLLDRSSFIIAFHIMATRKKSENSRAPFPILKIHSHRALADGQKEIARRLEATPEIAQLLLINPVCAFQDVGVEVSSEIASHIDRKSTRLSS